LTVRESRNRLSVEIPALVAVLVGGAVLFYWLSTAIPFDASEFALLSEASVRDHGVRVPFIMFNGLSLFALYPDVRNPACSSYPLAIRRVQAPSGESPASTD
jgi:hypothetical protein